MGEHLHAQLGGRLERIVCQAVKAVVGDASRYAGVDGGAQRVNVCVGTLLAVAAVLFLGREALLEDDGHLALFIGIITGGAEVHQLHLAALCQHDIIGADVAVDNALSVHIGQRFHHRQQQGDKLIGFKTSFGVYVVFQGFAVDIFHNDVGGAVCLEVVQNVYHALLVIKGGDIFGFKQEALNALGEKTLLAFGDDDLFGYGVGAVGSARGIKLLYRDALAQHGVQTYVGDAEAAFAENVADEIFVGEHASGKHVVRRNL